MFWLKLFFCEYPSYTLKFLSIPWEKWRKQYRNNSEFLPFKNLFFFFFTSDFFLGWEKKNRKLPWMCFFTYTIFLLPFIKTRGKAAWQKFKEWLKLGILWYLCVCVLQPMSVVAPTAVTEAGAQPQKDGEKHPSSSYVTISSPLCKVIGVTISKTFLRM